MVKLSFGDRVWEIINNPNKISNSDYDFLLAFFSRPSKYEAFVVIVEHFGKVILEAWEKDGLFLSFFEHVHKFEVSTRRFLFANNRPRDRPNYLAFKVAQHLAIVDCR